MNKRNAIILKISCLLASLWCPTITIGQIADTTNVDRPWLQRESGAVRFATFNMALERRGPNDLTTELRDGNSQKAGQLAEIIQRVRPDILLLNEIDRDEDGENLELFHRLYLQVAQNGQAPIKYSHHFFAPSNTGTPSGVDLNNNGVLDEADDAFGFGRFPGQYAMAVLSQHPFAAEDVRTFQKFLWRDMPDAKWPKVPETNEHYYSDQARHVFRLSSKSHWMLPIQTPIGTVHFLCAHPTPPVFDGPEDRNGLRNHDEIRLLADLIDPLRSHYLVDDQGRPGGLPQAANFVIAGDMNADPLDGDSTDDAIKQLLNHPLINSHVVPASEGAVEAARVQGKLNLQHRGNAAHDTSDFNDDSVGNLRVDYVLPSQTLQVVACGVFWPPTWLPESQLVTASDHRLVWIDVRLKPE